MSGAVLRKHKVKLFGILFMIGLPTFAASPSEQERLASANAGFGFGLLKQIVREQPATNIFISPYSVSAVLEMIWNGAAGNTRREMERVLGTSGFQAAALNAAYRDTEQSIRKAQSNVVLTIANSIWYRPGIELKPEFVSVNKEFYGANLSLLDFTDPRAAGIVNAWAHQNTHGKITSIVQPPIPGTTQMLLANAVYFKGTWMSKFDPKETKERAFNLRNGAQKQTPMMQQHGKFAYQEGSSFQAVRLPYVGGRLGMYVILPATNSSLEKVLGDLDAGSWQNTILPRFGSREGGVILPRFKLDYGVDLKPPLMALGMKLLFAPGSADLSRMSAAPLYVDEVKQKSFVAVNEEGTEAAAVTVGTVAVTSVHQPQKPFEMIVDRPFLFLICDNQSKVILFMGLVFEPRAGEQPP